MRLTVPMRDSDCPACGQHVAVDFFEGGLQPLATIAWPRSTEEAASMKRHPLDFVRCVFCGHVYNAAFDYAEVPYADKPNLMFNRGANWSEFIRALQLRMVAQLPENPVVIEIGHGDGSFLAALSELRPNGRYIGFDPNGAATGGSVEFRQELFVPRTHLGELKPDLILMRHVLEHLKSSVAFLQELSFAASSVGHKLAAYLEVPCIDRVLETGRTVDFYFEHNSQFTTQSFSRMLQLSGARPEEVGHGYDGEIVFGFVRLGEDASSVRLAEEARSFHTFTRVSKTLIESQLDELASSGRRIAVWGGTGKSAAFLCRYGLDAKRFPLVVDSDPSKVGTYVPGTGQPIQFRDALLSHPADVIIVPPQWRAWDILAEIGRCGIEFGQILIEHDGRLVDLLVADHPYKRESPLAA